MARQPKPMKATLRPETDDDELERLLRPGRYYKRPADVLADATLSLCEQRAILSSWASDACAVESLPALRQLPLGEHPITFDEIMDALVQLDLPRADARQAEKRSADDPRNTGV